ncbi:unnamed protein product [Adineta steineri]|uniref:Uncharacterized protein n=1 Tax=Adineta steineri TaxID=433720 RepID=A0A815MJ01_9BILA|nr:unnamed protein product [Adineta steineri]CAF3997752.1 unnamed protein product [Adineta steineri]
MQFICSLIVALTFLVILHKTCAKNDDIISISSGTSFGRCVGRCRQSIALMADPLQVIISREANFNQASYPPIHVTSPIIFSEWNKLVSSVNLDIFQKLDDRSGCPDCADGGAEWIQVDWNNGSKRITFENGRTVQGLEELILTMRQIRQIYLSLSEKGSFSKKVIIRDRYETTWLTELTQRSFEI